MKVRLKDFWWCFADCIYPRLRPLSKEDEDRESERANEEQEEAEARIKTLPDDDNFRTQYLSGWAKLLYEAEEARRSVEARLTSTIGLSSIAGTIVFGAIIGLASGTLHVDAFWHRLVLSIGALYLVVQICCAILASIRGLERKNYASAQASDILPSLNETQKDYTRRQIALYTRRLTDMRSNTKEKVSQMALAHRAMKNFIVGLSLIAVIGTGLALAARNPDQGLIQALRKNYALVEMLRGPQGPRGAPGPKGDPGPPGPAHVSKE